VRGFGEERRSARLVVQRGEVLVGREAEDEEGEEDGRDISNTKNRYLDVGSLYCRIIADVMSFETENVGVKTSCLY
jgi:hypothetical protein